MTGPELDDVRSRADQEGFDYCFCSYSDFEDIKDEQFHTLRRAYVKAAEALKAYLNID